MKKYKCKLCGYIYSPEEGEPKSNIAPGTPFEEIPVNWKCPSCGLPKSKFIEV